MADRSYTSTDAFGHDHSVTVPESYWLNPPQEGVVLETTRNFDHTHEVRLSYSDLVAFSQGRSLVVKSSVQGHSHEFTIILKET